MHPMVVDGGGALRVVDYERIFRVLDTVGGAGSLPEFHQSLVGAVERHFGFRHVTCFRGSTLRSAFRDRAPLATNDHTRGRAIDEYHEVWGRHDVFATDRAIRRLEQASTVTLAQAGPLSRASQDYLRKYLGRWGIGARGAFTFRASPTETTLVGVFGGDEQDVGPQELALRLLARQLPHVARSVSMLAHPALPAPELTPRQRELAELVAEGLTNAAIGRRLCLSEETVKKYVSRLLGATGCSSRTELAVRVLAWT